LTQVQNVKVVPPYIVDLYAEATNRARREWAPGDITIKR
jgi:hypothetical protein